MLIKTYNAEDNFRDNHFHSNLRLFDVLPIFLLSTSETMHHYYLQIWYIRVVKRLKPEDLRKLGKIRKVSKHHRMIA